MDKVEGFRNQSDLNKGKRVKYLVMVDERPVPRDTMGTIQFVDDMGTIHVKWDNGSTLGLIQETDKFEIYE